MMKVLVKIMMIWVNDDDNTNNNDNKLVGKGINQDTFRP